MKSRRIAALALLFVGCAAPPAAAPEPLARRTPSPSLPPAVAPFEGAAVSVVAAGFVGAFAASSLAPGSPVRCDDAPSCLRRRPPASTFKVPHALFALDRGVITPATTFPGVASAEFPAWGETLDLAGALAASSVPWFQKVATKLTLRGEDELVDRFDYGDRHVGDDLTHFWLGGAEGGLTISPAEQVRFLRRFAASARLGGDAPPLPLTRPAAATELLAALPHEPGVPVVGKTGWAVREGRTLALWYVGLVLPDGRSPGAAFALVLDGDAATMADRKPTALRLLRAAGLLQ